MPAYLVNTNAQANGDHEVHEVNCAHKPALQHQKHLGHFDSCGPAVREAKKTYPKSNGCYYCCYACHTG